MISREQHDRMANAIRFLSMDAIEQANSGHPGLPMGAADVATVLFSRYLKVDPKTPLWPDRDRFVLSAGHGSMLLYSLLCLTGYEDMSIDDLRQFRQLGSKTAGHPEYGHAAGIETTTGPLGQGLANAVGMAIAERRLREEFGSELQDHFTYVLCGDGCLMEGISQEAIALAGHLNLNRLVLFWDDNRITIDGAVSLADSSPRLGVSQPTVWRMGHTLRLMVAREHMLDGTVEIDHFHLGGRPKKHPDDPPQRPLERRLRDQRIRDSISVRRSRLDPRRARCLPIISGSDQESDLMHVAQKCAAVLR